MKSLLEFLVLTPRISGGVLKNFWKSPPEFLYSSTFLLDNITIFAILDLAMANYAIYAHIGEMSLFLTDYPLTQARELARKVFYALPHACPHLSCLGFKVCLMPMSQFRQTRSRRAREAKISEVWCATPDVVNERFVIYTTKGESGEPEPVEFSVAGCGFRDGDEVVSWVERVRAALRSGNVHRT